MRNIMASDREYTPSRHPSQIDLFTFSKQPEKRQEETRLKSEGRSAPRFSLESAVPLLHKSHPSNPTSWNTSASSHINSSFSVSRTPPSFLHPGTLETIQAKLDLQERRLHQFVSIAKEKEAQVKRLERELKTCNEQNELLKGVVSDYELKGNRLICKTNESLERILQQKNCEIAGLKGELTLLRDQIAAKNEAEVIPEQQNLHIKTRKDLETAQNTLKELMVMNAELKEELSRYQRFEGSKTHINKAVFQAELSDIDATLQGLTLENSNLKREIHTLKGKMRPNQSELSELCGELYRLKCSVSMMNRVLAAIKDGARFNLGLLLRSRTEWVSNSSHTLSDCVSEVKAVVTAFHELESAAVEWYSKQCGEECKVA